MFISFYLIYTKELNNNIIKKDIEITKSIMKNINDTDIAMSTIIKNSIILVKEYIHANPKMTREDLIKLKEQLNAKIGNASNEIFALFMANIYEKIPDCILGQFSTLKFVNGSNFKKFKDYFLADYVSGFIVPADTFDNVKGKFPIGFTIWNTANKSKIKEIATDVFDKNGNYISTKNFYGELPNNINKWIKLFDEKTINGITFMGNPSPDFQHNNQLYLSLNKGIEHFNFYNFTQNNIIEGSIYFSVRNCIEATWLNDRDQFLYPNDNWKTDSK